MLEKRRPLCGHLDIAQHIITYGGPQCTSRCRRWAPTFCSLVFGDRIAPTQSLWRGGLRSRRGRCSAICSKLQRASNVQEHPRAVQDMLSVMHSEGCSTRLKLQLRIQQMCAPAPVQ